MGNSNPERLQQMLAGGDRRSLGRSGEVVELVLGDPARTGELVELLWDGDPVVRMRAADALEKASRPDGGRVGWPSCLERYRGELLGLMEETRQAEVRWHLALMISRLGLSRTEKRRAWTILERYGEDRSSIVKTCVMQGMWELGREDAELRAMAVERIRELSRSGTAAMRARGRKLLGAEGR
jgi:hypothetical protein